MRVMKIQWVAAAIAIASAVSVEGAAFAEEVAGVYDGVHPHWRDTVHISADGTYRRGNGDPGRWKAEGDILVLDWTNWGLVIMQRVGPGKFRARADGFTITKRRGEPPPAQPREPPREPRDCGTGLDDPGCSALRDGRSPMDKTELEGMLAALTGTSNELVRKDMALEILGSSLVTARQFGRVMALFNNELTRLEVVRERADRMVDPKRALGLASTFNNSLNGKEYVEIVSKLK
jgi:hypothetical protein